MTLELEQINWNEELDNMEKDVNSPQHFIKGKINGKGKKAKLKLVTQKRNSNWLVKLEN